MRIPAVKAEEFSNGQKGRQMAILFHSDDVDQFLSLPDAVRVAEVALSKISDRQGCQCAAQTLKSASAFRRSQL
jgi:hypothetical protein